MKRVRISISCGKCPSSKKSSRCKTFIALSFLASCPSITGTRISCGRRGIESPSFIATFTPFKMWTKTPISSFLTRTLSCGGCGTKCICARATSITLSTTFIEVVLTFLRSSPTLMPSFITTFWASSLGCKTCSSRSRSMRCSKCTSLISRSSGTSSRF